MGLFSEFTMGSLDFLAVLFTVALGVIALIAVVLFVIDISQTKDAIRRNYPVIGRFRYIFSTLGEFFRQYFFAMDREEMPFNRAEREWVYKSSEGVDNTVAFGSTRNLSPVGTPIFVNCAFPPLDEEAEDAPALLIGPHAREPYEASSIINISGMSYGALSGPAVRAGAAGLSGSGPGSPR